MLYGDKEIQSFFEKVRPEFLETFNALQTPVEKVDFWRYAVTHTFGGYYSDSDTMCIVPISLWARRYPNLIHRHTNFIVGIEATVSPEQKTWAKFCDVVQLEQWTFGCSKHHPLMTRILYTINAQVLAEKKGIKPVDGILWRTGPCIWTKIINEYIHEECHQNITEAGISCGNVTVLPVRAFATGGAFFEKAPKTPMLISHKYEGSWKKPKNSSDLDVVSKM